MRPYERLEKLDTKYAHGEWNLTVSSDRPKDDIIRTYVEVLDDYPNIINSAAYAYDSGNVCSISNGHKNGACDLYGKDWILSTIAIYIKPDEALQNENSPYHLIHPKDNVPYDAKENSEELICFAAKLIRKEMTSPLAIDLFLNAYFRPYMNRSGRVNMIEIYNRRFNDGTYSKKEVAEKICAELDIPLITKDSLSETNSDTCFSENVFLSACEPHVLQLYFTDEYISMLPNYLRAISSHNYSLREKEQSKNGKYIEPTYLLEDI